MVTEDDRYPIRNLQDFKAELAGMRVFSKIDLVKGYHQVPVAKVDEPKTASITTFGLFEFVRMPFGLKDSAKAFLCIRFCAAFLAILIASENEEQHTPRIDSAFRHSG